MGLGRLFSRSMKYDVTNTVTGETNTFTIVDNVSPDWATAGYHGAMGIPGVWRASVLLSDLLGAVPWDAYRQRAGNPVETISAPLLEQPAPPDTRMTTFSSLALDLVFHGNAVGVYAARNLQGYPTAIVPVPADSVGARRARPGDLFPEGEIIYDIYGREFSAYDVLHVKGPCKPGSLRGMGILETHLDTLTLASEQARQARSLTTHGVPTGKLKVSNPDATEQDMKDVKVAWLKAQASRTVAVLNSTTDFEPLSWNPTETQLLEARHFSLKEVALIFGLDPSWLGATDSSRVYSNIEQEAINLVKFSLGGHLARFEQALSLAFPRGTTVKANLDALLRADTLTRYQAHSIAIDKGFLTTNEVRELEDRPPFTEPKPAQKPAPTEPPADSPPAPAADEVEAP